MKIGAQFYTLRNYCKTTEGLAECLKKVADIGYTTVQLSGVCDYDYAWIKGQLEKNGLQCVLTHTAQDRMLNETEQVIYDHDVMGCKYIGLGSYNFDPAQGGSFEDFLGKWVPVAQKFADAGKLFMYHNHDGEFRKLADGRIVLDHMLEKVPAEIMGFTLDTFWVQAGGGDPAQWLEKMAGRIPCIHLKDFAYGRKMAVIGEGNINFDRVFEKAAAGGTQYMLVEQDDCNGEDPMECLRRSYLYLKSCGFN